MGIVRFALKFPYTFYVVAAFIVFLGVSAIWVMPEDIFPEISIPVVSVIWQYTGLGVPEMEQRGTSFPPCRQSRPRTLADRRSEKFGPRRTAGRYPAANRSAIQRLERSSAAA